jgi:NADPH:quinone reductase-like Zn-dependent oxidoreductase
MKYKSVQISKRGGPEVLTVVENELRSPLGKEVLIKIQACGVGGTDVSMRYFNYPAAPKLPFVPGYEIVGVVQEKGPEVTRFKRGERVAALSVFGGYSEYIYLKEEHLVTVPESLDAGEVASVILNYTSAYQMLRKAAKVQSGEHVLVTGASGGVGTALLDLGKMYNLVLYGTASKNKHELLNHFEAKLIDYKNEDFIEVIRNLRPDGLDFVFDGIGRDFIIKSFKVLRRGGLLIEYGFSFESFSVFTKSIFDLFSGIPQGKKARGYGISVNYKMNRKSVQEDISAVFSLLANGKIKPLIYKRMPILEAAEANRLLESGEVTGKIVLVN